jgi:hypothetical protein
VREFSSYYINEQHKGETIEDYEERKKSVALSIREESQNPDVFIDEWLKILDHKCVGKKIMKLKEVDYEIMKILAMGLGQQCYNHMKSRWNNLTSELQRNLIPCTISPPCFKGYTIT